MKRTTRPDRPAEARYACSDIYTGGVSFEGLIAMERANEARDAVERVRGYYRKTLILQAIVRAKLSFYNYGCAFRPALKPGEKRAAPGYKARTAALAEWLATGYRANDRRLREYLKAAWREWILTRNLVSFWRENPADPKLQGKVLIFGAERCKYTDAFGLESLKIMTGYKPAELRGFGLPQAEQARYTNSYFDVDEEKGECFRVLKDGPVGEGFAWPTLYAALAVLAQNESMEVSERTIGYAARQVRRIDRIGWEPRSNRPLDPKINLWTVKRSDAITKGRQGKLGLLDEVQQFDHTSELFVPDAKFYDARKWDTIKARLIQWSGPVGYMLEAKQFMPFLMPLLQAEATAERLDLGLHFAEVLNRGFALPPAVGEIEPVWSNRCFADQRLAWDMVKAMIQQGGASLRTGAETAGLDRDQEIDRMDEEAKLPKEHTMPLHDPAHGGSPQKDGAGRPKGKPETDTNPGQR